MYMIMIISLISLLFVCYVAFNREILCPPVIAVAMFLFSAVVGLSRYDDWEIAEYSGVSVVLIMAGLLSFIFSSFFVFKMFPRNAVWNIAPVNRERIELSSLFLYCAILLLIVHDYLYYDYIVKNVENAGYFGLSFGVMINFFRRMGMTESTRLLIPSYLQVLNFISYVLNAFSIFVLMHNIIFQRFKRRDFFLVVIILLALMYNLLNGNRSAILHLLSRILCYVYFFKNMKVGWSLAVSKKVIKMGAKMFAVFIPFFVVLAILLGRYGGLDRFNSNDFSAMNHVSSYISSGIRNFDLYVKEPISDDTIFGKETFFSINRFFYNRFGIGEFYDPNLEFRSIQGKNIGNIYTVFRRYYADFGIIGLILLPQVLGVFFTYLYCKAKGSAIDGKVSFFIPTFAVLSYSIFYFPVDDTFFHFDIGAGNIVRFILLYILYCFVKDHDRIIIKFRRHSSSLKLQQ